MKRLEPKKLVHIKHIEVSLGGDHGKGSYIFLAIVKLCYTMYKDAYQFELKLGEINEEKDKIDFIIELLKKLYIGLTEMNIKRGDCYMSITDQRNITFTSDYDMNSTLIKFYTIGYLKALFRVLGRDGYDYSYCLYCKFKSKSWKEQYKSSSACINAEKWTVEKYNMWLWIGFKSSPVR